MTSDLKVREIFGVKYFMKYFVKYLKKIRDGLWVQAV